MIFEGVSNFRKKKRIQTVLEQKNLACRIVFYSHQQNRLNLRSQKLDIENYVCAQTKSPNRPPIPLFFLKLNSPY